MGDGDRIGYLFGAYAWLMSSLDQLPSSRPPRPPPPGGPTKSYLWGTGTWALQKLTLLISENYPETMSARRRDGGQGGVQLKIAGGGPGPFQRYYCLVPDEMEFLDSIQQYIIMMLCSHVRE